VVLPFRPANTLTVLTTADLEIAAVVLDTSDARASSPKQLRQLINEIAPRFAGCEVTEGKRMHMPPLCRRWRLRLWRRGRHRKIALQRPFLPNLTEFNAP
jgi:hypothetical protein